MFCSAALIDIGPTRSRDVRYQDAIHKFLDALCEWICGLGSVVPEGGSFIHTLTMLHDA